jgi:hypothetical protein
VRGGSAGKRETWRHAGVRDRGSNLTASFDAVFQAAGTTILPTAAQGPQMNATCERLGATA